MLTAEVWGGTIVLLLLLGGKNCWGGGGVNDRKTKEEKTQQFPLYEVKRICGTVMTKLTKHDRGEIGNARGEKTAERFCPRFARLPSFTEMSRMKYAKNFYETIS